MQISVESLYHNFNDYVKHPKRAYLSEDENSRAVFGIIRVGSDMFELTVHADRVRVSSDTLLSVR